MLLRSFREHLRGLLLLWGLYLVIYLFIYLFTICGQTRTNYQRGQKKRVFPRTKKIQSRRAKNKAVRIALALFEIHPAYAS